MRGLRVLAASFMMAALLCAAPRLFAAPTLNEVYETHSREAERLYQAGRYEEAIEELRAAYAIIPRPGLLLNQGHAFLALKHPREALRLYERYKEKRESGTPEDDVKLQRYIDRARNLAEMQDEPPPVGWQTDGSQLSAPVPAPMPVIVVQAPPQKGPALRQPVYRKWWFWTGIGAVVAAGIVTGTVVGVLHGQGGPTPDAGAQIYRPEFP